MRGLLAVIVYLSPRKMSGFFNKLTRNGDKSGGILISAFIQNKKNKVDPVAYDVISSSI